MLVLVGCCYNLIPNESFPLSKAAQIMGLQLSVSQKMLACQSPLTWTDGQATTNFTKHYYRALLQLVISRETDFIGDIKVGKLASDVSSGDFVQYAVAALTKLNIVVVMAVLARYQDAYLSRKKELAIFWTLRSMFARVVEWLILKDRQVYLEESNQCSKVELVALFDPTISPRNTVLLAYKK